MVSHFEQVLPTCPLTFIYNRVKKSHFRKAHCAFWIGKATCKIPNCFEVILLIRLQPTVGQNVIVELEVKKSHFRKAHCAFWIGKARCKIPNCFEVIFLIRLQPTVGQNVIVELEVKKSHFRKAHWAFWIGKARCKIPNCFEVIFLIRLQPTVGQNVIVELEVNGDFCHKKDVETDSEDNLTTSQIINLHSCNHYYCMKSMFEGFDIKKYP